MLKYAFLQIIDHVSSFKIGALIGLITIPFSMDYLARFALPFLSALAWYFFKRWLDKKYTK